MADPIVKPVELEGAQNAPAGAPKIDLAASTTTAASGGMGNIFTQAQAKKEDSQMISSIISQKDVAQKMKSILGAAPTLEKSIEQSKEASLKRKVRTVQIAFLLVLTTGLIAAGYFYSELSPNFSFFGANTTQRLTDANTNLRHVQTMINKSRYMSAQFKLNEFSYEADQFLSDVIKQSGGTASDDVNVELENLQKSLPAILVDVRTELTKPLVVPVAPTEKEPLQTEEQYLQAAQDDLRAALQEEKKKYGQNPTDRQDLLDVKLLDNTMKLVGNTKLLNTLQKTSADGFQKQLADYAQAPDSTKLKALQDVLGKILASTKSDLATIADVKHARIEWSAIIGHIKEVTLEVHGSNFDQPQVYERLGGVVYNGYEFDTNTNKIVLSGTTKTLDGSNFTLMSNLIDTLENSPYFKDVEMRSFSKSKAGNNDGEYLANFKIDLSFETESFDEKNKPLVLENAPVEPASGASRQLPAVVDEPLPSITAPVPEPVVAPVAPAAPVVAPAPAQTATPFSASAPAIFNTLIQPAAVAPTPSASAPAPSVKKP